MNSGISGYTLEAPFSILIDNTDKDDFSKFISSDEILLEEKKKILKEILNKEW